MFEMCALRQLTRDHMTYEEEDTCVSDVCSTTADLLLLFLSGK